MPGVWVLTLTAIGGVLQFLRFNGPLGPPVDGVVSEGSAMVMALQQCLNEGRF